ncbi:MAG: hypothetical protein ACFB0G_10325 [Leptolyngbyaceae cyanobacterium]
MSDFTVFLIVTVLLALIPGLLVTLLFVSRDHLWKSAKQNINKNRNQKWEEIAATGRQLGLTFQKEISDLQPILNKLPQLQLSQTRSSIPYSLVGRIDETDVWILDFGAQEFVDMPEPVEVLSQGWIYVLIRSESLHLPAFYLRPTIQLPFSSSIKLARYPQFSKRNKITGEPRQSVEALFSSSLISFLNSQPRCLTLRGHEHFLLYGKGWRNPDQINTLPKLNELLKEGLTLKNLFSEVDE